MGAHGKVMTVSEQKAGRGQKFFSESERDSFILDHVTQFVVFLFRNQKSHNDNGGSSL